MKKLKTVDKRMLTLITYLMDRDGLTQEEVCNKIGYNNTNMGKIKNGKQSFRIEHIQAAMKLLRNGNFNWLFGVEDNMTRKVPVNPIEALKQSVKQVEEKFK